MSETKVAGAERLQPAQATELSLLVDLEACWENLRKAPGGPADANGTRQDLQTRQRAYEAFRARLAAYNSRHAPAHVPELLLNTPTRLGQWCRRMRDLYLQIEHDPGAHCPAHLLEKAHRRADRIGVRQTVKSVAGEAVDRVPPPASIRAVIDTLEELVRWCDSAGATAPPG
jgi:hypothetical protein